MSHTAADNNATAYATTAEKIITLVGRIDNIEHCSTRLRLNLYDNSQVIIGSEVSWSPLPSRYLMTKPSISRFTSLMPPVAPKSPMLTSRFS